MEPYQNSPVHREVSSNHHLRLDSLTSAQVDNYDERAPIRGEFPDIVISEDTFLDKWLRSSSIGSCINCGDCDSWWLFQPGSLY